MECKNFKSHKENFEIEIDIDKFRKISYLQIIKFGSDPTELALLLNTIIDYLNNDNIQCVIQKITNNDYEVSFDKNEYFEKIGGDDEYSEISCDTKNLGVGIMSALGFDI